MLRVLRLAVSIGDDGFPKLFLSNSEEVVVGTFGWGTLTCG